MHASSDNDNEDFEVYAQSLLECEAMLRRYMGRGINPIKLSPRVMETVANARHPDERPSLRELYAAHSKLAEAVAPAQPSSLLLLESEDGGRLQVPLIRSLMFVALSSLIAVFVLGGSPLVDADPRSGNPLLSSGMELFVNQAFFLSTALLGASFHALFTVKRYVTDGNYDPAYRSTYWIRLILGMMAGWIMSSLIHIDADSALHGVGRPLIALLGGFSSSAIYRVLERLVVVLETSVVGLNPARPKARQNVAAGNPGSQRAEIAATLVALQSKLASGLDPDAAQRELSRMVSGVLDGELRRSPNDSDHDSDDDSDHDSDDDSDDDSDHDSDPPSPDPAPTPTPTPTPTAIPVAAMPAPTPPKSES